MLDLLWSVVQYRSACFSAEQNINNWRECLLLSGMVFTIGVLASLRSRIQKKHECLLLCGAEFKKTLGGNAGSSAECSSAEWCSLSECLLLEKKKTLGRNA